MNREEWCNQNRERDEKIVAHYAASKSLRKTAAEFGLCPQRIHQIVKRMESRKQ